MALFDTEAEAEEHIEGLINGLVEKEVYDDEPGYEKTVYGTIDLEQEGYIEVHTYQPGYPTDEDLVSLIVEEHPTATMVLGEVHDETCKRIIVVDMLEGDDPSAEALDDEPDPDLEED